MTQNKLPGTQPHPLLGRYDLDPGRWRPLFYGVEISVPVTEGGIGRGAITLNNQPYIWTRCGHKIIGNTANPSASGLYQDGQYDLAFRDEQSNYQNQPIPADLMFGAWGTGSTSPSGFLVELPYPIPYAGNKTITFEITNRILRSLVPESDYFRVFVCMGGVSDWGQLGPRG